jgi:hypothetical protein
MEVISCFGKWEREKEHCHVIHLSNLCLLRSRVLHKQATRLCKPLRALIIGLARLLDLEHYILFTF